MEAFKWIWQHIKVYKLRMTAGLLLVLVVCVLSMVNPYITGSLVDDVILGRNTGLLKTLIIIMLAVTLLRSVIRYVFQMTFESVSQGIYRTVRQNIYTKLQELDFNYFDKTRTGDIMARMTGDMDMVRHFTAWVIYGAFENIAVFVFAIIYMFIINTQFTLILLAITPVSALLANKFAKEVRPTFSAIREQFSRLNTVVQENISGNRVVKAFARESYEIDKFTSENDAYKQKNVDSAKVGEKYLPVMDSLANIFSVIMIFAGGIMVIRHLLTLGELVVFNSLIWALNNPMRMLGLIINDTQRFSASGEKILTILNAEPKIKNSSRVMEKDKIFGAVEFKNVSFSYDEEKILNDISFKAKPGQTIAIVGPTGSGKSTLVSLITRFYECNGGEVLIDGVDIKNIDLQLLRKNISSAMQDIFLFSDTIEGNIAYGVPDATMDQVMWAAKIAGAHNFIESFPEGYDTIIGERGVGLSGGQKQRIALARAILKDPSILVLDDTTSSVDVETEYEIQKALKTIFSGKTTFIIAHRISSVKNADLILVIDKGIIIERGKHSELIEKKGYYYNVYINQYGDFDNVCEVEVV